MLIHRIWQTHARYGKRILAIIVIVLMACGASATANAADWQTTWSTATLSQARSALSAASVGGKVFFGGGWQNTPSDVVDIYDTAFDSWSTARLSQTQSALSATSTGGKVFFGGGAVGGGVFSDVVNIYDTAVDSWSSATLSEPRSSLSAASAGGKVLFGGGRPGSVAFSDVVDIYDTATDSWSAARLSQARDSLSAASAGGKVFFGGGWNNGPSNVVDIYDTATGSWSTERLSQAREKLSATSAGGKVFFGGGWNNGPSNVVDIYDTATGSWSTERLSQARYQLSATSAGGKVFFSGGKTGGGGFSDVVDIYDTATDSWSTARLSQARSYLSATSAGGKVFFGGGETGGGSSDVVDIYLMQQIYDSITSSKVFTLDDHTTVAGQMQLSAPGSLNLATYNLTVGSMSGNAPINLGGNTLTVGSNSSPAPYFGAITGGGDLIKVGAGQLGVRGPLSADITLSQGSIEAGPGAIINGDITIDEGARLENNGGAMFLGDLENNGVFKGSAQVSGNFLNNTNGNVRIGAGQRVGLFGFREQINDGLIEVIGTANLLGWQAEFESRGPLFNLPGTGLIVARNATLRFNGTLINDGSLALSFGTSDVFGDIANNGNITIASDAIVTFFGDVDQQNILAVSTGARADFFGAFTGGGGFTGGGDVYLLGDLRPGNSPADVVMQGNLYLAASTTTQIELGGPAPGTQYDRLSISGDVHFAGSLTVETIDAGEGLFRPAVGDRFVVATYESYSGEFITEQLPALSQPGARWSVDYGDRALTLTVAGLPGDIDIDGDVDRRDVASFAGGLGTSGVAQWTDGDFDFDGATSLLDLAVLQSRFGTRVAVSAAALPEPATATMLCLALLFASGQKRRRLPVCRG